MEAILSSESNGINVTIWRHQEDGHLFVDYCIGGGPIRFLVRAEDMVAWSLDGYLKLVQISVQADQAAALSQLSKSIIAFIRHGMIDRLVGVGNPGGWQRLLAKAGVRPGPGA